MGFTISDHHVTLALRAGLEPDTWDSHLDLLRTSYLDWIFDSGYLSGKSLGLITARRLVLTKQ